MRGQLLLLDQLAAVMPDANGGLSAENAGSKE